MEYIEFRNNKYHAKEGEVEIDNITFFDSRRNHAGLGGTHISFEIGQFNIEWVSNFYYGSLSSGTAIINFKNIYIRSYQGINSTQLFVDILNKYADANNIDKDAIIVNLANKLAYFRESIGRNFYAKFGNQIHWNDPRYLKPSLPLEEFEEDIDFIALKKLGDIKASNK